MNNELTRKHFIRPIVVSLIFTTIAELFLLLYYGIYLSDEGSILDKIIWTLGFCGVGMGLSLGGLINLFIVGRFNQKTRIILTTICTTLTLGIACNWLCMNLDRHFRFFGGADDPLLHFLPSFIGSIIGGWLLGWLLFTTKGNLILNNIGL